MQIKVKIKENSFIARIAAGKLKANRVAIVIGNTIHLHNTSRENFMKDVQWVRHEIIHVLQFRTHGFISFIFKYYQSLLSFHNIFIIVLPQMIIEILITYVMSFMSTYLSIQSFKLTFIQKDNFSLKYLFNYILNYLIIICFLIFISALLKIYLI